MNRKSRLGTALAVLVTSASVAACGGSSSSSSSASASASSTSSSSGLSRTEIVAKANAICAAGSAAGKAIPAPASFQDATVAAKYFNAVVPIVTRSLSQLEVLKPDSSVSADWNAYMAQRRLGVTLLETIQRKANAKDPSGLKDLQQAPAMQARLVSLAKAVGATKCAQ